MRTLALLTPILAAALVSCSDDPTQPRDPTALPSLSSASRSLSLSGQLLDAAQGETDATGTATVRCVNHGTLFTLHFSGLAPKGVYTVWGFTVGAGGNAFGALGASDGSQNVFHASASGEAQFSLLLPPGGTASFTGAPWPGCALPPALLFLVIDGHLDGTSHGGVPGPNNYDLMLLEP